MFTLHLFPVGHGTKFSFKYFTSKQDQLERAPSLWAPTNIVFTSKYNVYQVQVFLIAASQLKIRFNSILPSKRALVFFLLRGQYNSSLLALENCDLSFIYFSVLLLLISHQITIVIYTEKNAF